MTAPAIATQPDSQFAKISRRLRGLGGFIAPGGNEPMVTKPLAFARRVVEELQGERETTGVVPYQRHHRIEREGATMSRQKGDRLRRPCLCRSPVPQAPGRGK